MKPLNKTEIKELERKLALPTVRKGPKKQVVPPKLTDAEMNHLIFVMMKPMRDANRKKFGGGAVQKNWTKMSKAERAVNV